MENNNRQGCRWTKASERLSQHYVNMCCRLMGEEFYFTAYYDYSKQLYIPRNFSGGGYLKPEEIEYLDESIEPCATSSENYWKQRCEAAEDLINYIPIPSKEDFSTSEEAAYYKWKELKSQTPSPTGDRDCEELKKENEALRQRISEIVYLSEQKGGYHP